MNFFLNKKIKAGALQYTMFISVILVILLSTFLTLTFLQNHFKMIVDFRIENVHNANIGFQYNLANEIPYDAQQELKLLVLAESKLFSLRTHWGIFDILNVKSIVKNHSFQKIGLIGGFQVNRPALYLKDNYNALVLVGNTNIQGDVFLPENGVKGGNISGHSYYGNKLIYGTISQSNSKLPVIKNRSYLEELSRGVINIENLSFIGLAEGKKIVNSFSKPTQIYKQPEALLLKNIKLTGNIIIQSDSLIRVENTAKLNDVLLIAPTIEIMNHTAGNFQAIASKNIVVGNNCNLTYPSVLFVNEEEMKNSVKQHKDQNSKIQISPSSSIKGIVAFLSNNETNNYKPQISIEETSKVIGEVYCDKNFELKGTVIGSVYTTNFVANQFGSIYQNHIYNGTILETELPKQYVGLSIKNSTSKISEWLY